MPGGSLGTLLEEAVRRIRSRYRVELIILHGSYAKGTYVEGLSDVDLLVVSDDFEGVPMGERLSSLAELLAGMEVPVEAVGLTRREFLGGLRSFNPLVLDSLEYGVPLYDRGLYREALQEFEGLKRRGLRRIRDGWDLSALAPT